MSSTSRRSIGSMLLTIADEIDDVAAPARCGRLNASSRLVSAAPRSAARLIASASAHFGSSGSSMQRQQIGRAENGRQHVVEVVRHAAGEAADGVHLLRLPQLIFERETLA